MGRTPCWVLVGSLMLIVNFSSAQELIPCPPMPDKITQVNRDISVDVKAGIGSMGKLKAGDFGVKVTEAAKSLSEKYPNADRLFIAQMMSATYCPMIRDSKDLKDSEKRSLWSEFTDRIMKFQNPDYKPPALKRKSAPANTQKSTQHSYIVVDNFIPHVAPPPASSGVPPGNGVVNVDVGMKNTLAPSTLLTYIGTVYTEPGVSLESEKDAITKATEQFKSTEVRIDEPYKLGPFEPASFIVNGVLAPSDISDLLHKNKVLYVVGLIIYSDQTGEYGKQFCRAITIRTLPDGSTKHYDLRCHGFGDEMARNKSLKTFM